MSHPHGREGEMTFFLIGLTILRFCVADMDKHPAVRCFDGALFNDSQLCFWAVEPLVKRGEMSWQNATQAWTMRCINQED